MSLNDQIKLEENETIQLFSRDFEDFIKSCKGKESNINLLLSIRRLKQDNETFFDFIKRLFNFYKKYFSTDIFLIENRNIMEILDENKRLKKIESNKIRNNDILFEYIKRFKNIKTGIQFMRFFELRFPEKMDSRDYISIWYSRFENNRVLEEADEKSKRILKIIGYINEKGDKID